jgi:hypothetical protein
MKQYLSVAIAFLAFISIADAQELPLETILTKHYQAMGYDNLQRINTVLMTGTLVQNDVMPVKITRERPNFFLMESDVADITSFQGFDGQTAWWTIPWTGNPKPQLMPEDRAKEMSSRADFEGILYHWKDKGHSVELAGTDTVENSPVYKFKITRKDGGVEFLFLDMKKFILLKRMYSRVIRGQEVPIENFYRDYRPVQGFLFAFTQDMHFGGQPYNSLQLESIEVNKPVDAKMFKMPSR